MPTIKLNRQVFEKLVGKKLSTEELKDRISMLGTDLEKIEGNEIEVEIFPNRPDLLSEQGLARALSSFIGVKKGLRKYDVKDSKQQIIVDNSVKKARPYTACAIVKNINLDDEKIKELIKIQEKLHVTYGRNRKKAAIGIYPLEKIKFPITYFAEDPKKVKFRPLEYDQELDGLQVLRKHSAGREYAHLLEGEEKFPFFRDAEGKILSMPPIINSHDVGKITTNTKELFIECSGFEFEHQSKCLNMIVTALSEMGGEIHNLELKYDEFTKKTPDLSPAEWSLDLDYVNKRLGLELSEKELKELLSRMGHDYEKGKVYVPPYRTDILHPVDFTEDVAIAYGYENFTPTIPEVSTIAEEDPFEKFKKKISEILIGLGLIEVETYHLTNEENQNKKMLAGMDLIELESAVNTEYNVLRSWVIPSLMEVLNKNLNREYPQHIFGTGKIFKKGDTETGVKEDERIGVTLCDEKTDFTSIKQILDHLMRRLDLQYEIEETEYPSFIPGRVGRVKVNGKRVAYIGEIHPQVLENWQLSYPVTAFELNLTDIYEILKE